MKTRPTVALLCAATMRIAAGQGGVERAVACTPYRSRREAEQRGVVGHGIVEDPRGSKMSFEGMSV